MRKAIILCFTSLAVLFSKTIFAQQQYFFTNYTVKDGLSNPVVQSMVKDADGFLWVGTGAGLNRFNGSDFVVYKSQARDTTTLPSNSIGHLLVDHSGRLWISTDQGICVYEKNKNRFRRISIIGDDGRKIPFYAGSALFEDSKKNIWVGGGFGLLIYDAQKECFVTWLSRLSGPGLHSLESAIGFIMEDLDGTLWAIGRTHLLHVNPGKNVVEEFEFRSTTDNAKTFQGIRVFPDALNRNYLWIGSWGNGMVHFSKETGQFTSYKFEFNIPANISNIIFDIHQREQNKLWLATNRGLLVFDAEKKIFEGFIRDSLHETPVVNSEAYHIYKDDEGITWLGTAAGFCNINPAKQNFISHPVWDYAPVMVFYPDKISGRIYGTRYYNNRSLFIYDPETKSQTVYSIPGADKLRAEPFSVYKNSRGLIWIGTTKGIYTFNETEKKFRLFDLHTSLKISDRLPYVADILEDRSGYMWFASYRQGLIRYDFRTEAIDTFFYNPSDTSYLQISTFTRIIEGKGKFIYALGENPGIAKLDVEKNTFENFSPKVEKYSPLFGCVDMALDSEGNLWVTTRNNGLVCISREGNVRVYLKDDLGNLVDEQRDIVVDASGKIWLTASNGLYRFDPSSKSFTHFTLQDGLPLRTVGQITRMSDGSIAFIFQKGINRFYPEQLSKKEKPLQVHLTSFSVNGKISSFSNIIDVLDTVRLNHTENSFTVEFAAPNFTNPAATVYSYMLEGVDKDWSSPSGTRVVNFAQLIPGDYRLRIRAGHISPEKIIFISIIPAWWQTTLFKWFAVMLAISILYYFIRFFLSLRYKQKIAALERQREIESIRIRISRDIHDEIGSGLTKISMMSSNLQEQTNNPADAQQLSDKIQKTSRDVIESLGEIVWTVNPKNDSLGNLLAYLREYCGKYFYSTSIRHKLEITLQTEEQKQIELSPEVKRNLLMIVKEALNNVVKHSGASECEIKIFTNKNFIYVRVNDNGNGYKPLSFQGGLPKDEPGRANAGGGVLSGNGLKNMQKRAEELNGTFNMTSDKIQGTSITVSVPFI